MRRSAQLAAIVLALILGAAFATYAQQFRPVNPLPEPKVLSGPDVGFRVTGMRGNTPFGELVVRVNGEWVPAEVGELLTAPYQRPR